MRVMTFNNHIFIVTMSSIQINHNLTISKHFVFFPAVTNTTATPVENILLLVMCVGIRAAITKTNPFSTHMRADLWKGESGRVAGFRIRRHAAASVGP